MIPANQLRVGNFVNCPSKNETMCEVQFEENRMKLLNVYRKTEEV